MAKRDIRIVGDPVLRTECDPIKDITPGVRALVEDLLENVNEEGRAGLAANQIGVSLRAFSWNIDGELGYILNPVITYLSEEKQGESGVRGHRPRRKQSRARGRWNRRALDPARGGSSRRCALYRRSREEREEEGIAGYPRKPLDCRKARARPPQVSTRIVGKTFRLIRKVSPWLVEPSQSTPCRVPLHLILNGPSAESLVCPYA